MSAPFLLGEFRSGKLSEIFEGKNSGRMPVPPDGLDGVAAHAANPNQLKRRRHQLLARVFMEVAKDVHLALAAGARAMPP
jgi:hypothetical protein